MVEAFDARVTTGGRVTIPDEIRRELGIIRGDWVRVSITKLVVQEVEGEDA